MKEETVFRTWAIYGSTSNSELEGCSINQNTFLATATIHIKAILQAILGCNGDGHEGSCNQQALITKSINADVCHVGSFHMWARLISPGLVTAPLGCMSIYEDI